MEARMESFCTFFYNRISLLYLVFERGASRSPGYARSYSFQHTPHQPVGEARPGNRQTISEE